ncbi:uncharacterized protein LOC127079631 [Lathyrus oleraceus]|uniref:uncharacterized protein LOC127079631 n=1 Tax=Pisum sativum TaxID=3888 RepID=UPI0021D2F3A9|nr:uncharacterized protein LOC127079631 [Pisum sativum]
MVQYADSNEGDYGGKLMAVVGRGENNKIYPIAYVVGEAETKDSWEWFVNILIEDLESINHMSYAFISDQHKSLVPVVQSVSAHVEQHLCVKHLYGNWKKKYYGLESKEVMWSATKVATIALWEREMLRMKGLNEAAWNMCKAFNMKLLEYRDKPIINMLEGIKHYLTKLKISQKDALSKYNGDICHIVQLVLVKNKKVAENWTPTWHGDDDLDIYGMTNRNKTYVVNLNQTTHACRKWDLTGIPCCHAITFIWKNKKQPEEYNTFKKTYSHIIFPTHGPQLLPFEDQVAINPPVMRRAIGHPKKMRRKVIYEPRNPHVLPRKLSTVTFHKCRAMGHNKRSYKGKRVADRAIPKGGNTKKANGGNASEVGNNKKVNGGNNKKVNGVNRKKNNSTNINASEVGSSSQAPQPI